MLEILILVSVLSALTLVVAILYSKRIREAQEKYAEAKDTVEDVVISFNRQLQRQEDKLEASVHKVSALSGRCESLTQKLEDQRIEVQGLAERVESFSTLGKAVTRIDALETRLTEVASTKDMLLQKIAQLEKREGQKRETEAKIKAAIPIKREKALAPLTETELTVLELLATEGERTAPEIKERIELSREHTARLMKKLYEKGYLERSANKIPFTYRVKEEMRRILKKPEQKAS